MLNACRRQSIVHQIKRSTIVSLVVIIEPSYSNIAMLVDTTWCSIGVLNIPLQVSAFIFAMKTKTNRPFWMQNLKVAKVSRSATTLESQSNMFVYPTTTPVHLANLFIQLKSRCSRWDFEFIMNKSLIIQVVAAPSPIGLNYVVQMPDGRPYLRVEKVPVSLYQVIKAAGMFGTDCTYWIKAPDGTVLGYVSEQQNKHCLSV